MVSGAGGDHPGDDAGLGEAVVGAIAARERIAGEGDGVGGADIGVIEAGRGGGGVQADVIVADRSVQAGRATNGDAGGGIAVIALAGGEARDGEAELVDGELAGVCGVGDAVVAGDAHGEDGAGGADIGRAVGGAGAAGGDVIPAAARGVVGGERHAADMVAAVERARHAEGGGAERGARAAEAIGLALVVRRDGQGRRGDHPGDDAGLGEAVVGVIAARERIAGEGDGVGGADIGVIEAGRGGGGVQADVIEADRGVQAGRATNGDAGGGIAVIALAGGEARDGEAELVDGELAGVCGIGDAVVAGDAHEEDGAGGADIGRAVGGAGAAGGDVIPAAALGVVGGERHVADIVAAVERAGHAE